MKIGNLVIINLRFNKGITLVLPRMLIKYFIAYFMLVCSAGMSL
jgi:hypothetical protein